MTPHSWGGWLADVRFSGKHSSYPDIAFYLLNSLGSNTLLTCREQNGWRSSTAWRRWARPSRSSAAAATPAFGESIWRSRETSRRTFMPMSGRDMNGSQPSSRFARWEGTRSRFGTRPEPDWDRSMISFAMTCAQNSGGWLGRVVQSLVSLRPWPGRHGRKQRGGASVQSAPSTSSVRTCSPWEARSASDLRADRFQRR